MLTRVHHVGLVVRRLADGLAFWQDTLGLRVSKQATVEDQGVKAALLPIGRSEIELLEPINPGGGVAKFLERRGEGLHHVCFETPDVAVELAAARRQEFPLIDEAPRPGLAGMICFLHPKGTRGVLVEFATPGKVTGVAIRAGDIVVMQSAGGGGYGDPLARDPDRVRADESVLDYIMALVAATRSSPLLSLGVSPRGSLALLRAARAQALADGRGFLVPDDVKGLAVPALAHRVMVKGRSEQGGGIDPEDVVRSIVQDVPVPR